LLKFDSGAQRINRTGELDQGTVAGQLDQATSVFLHYRIEMFGTVLAQARQCPALVPPKCSACSVAIRMPSSTFLADVKTSQPATPIIT
jgi:hypothetical protein